MPEKKSNWVTRLKGKVQRRFRAKQRMVKGTAKQNRYAKHYKAAGPKYAMTYVEWSKKGGRSTEARLREAHITEKEIKKLLRK